MSQGAQAFATLTLADAEKIRSQSQTVVAVSPVIVGRSQVIAPGGNWRTAINGVDTDYQTIRDWQTDSGAFFGPDDVRAARSVAVLGRTVAQRIFAGSDPVGQEIQIAALRFKVTGVLAPKGQTASGSDSDDVILIPYTTAATRLTGKPRIPQILASTASEGDIPAAQEEISTLLRESHHISGDDDDDFTVRNQTDLATAAESSTRVMTLLMAAIASISLLVGGIGIMNIMLVSVTERTREIGIRLAIGARGSDVLIQFLVESIVMGILGGVVGLASRHHEREGACALHGMGDGDLAARHDRRGRLLGCGGGLLRLLPGAEGGGAEPDRGPEVRVIQARAVLTPVFFTVTSAPASRASPSGLPRLSRCRGCNGNCGSLRRVETRVTSSVSSSIPGFGTRRHWLSRSGAQTVPSTSSGRARAA